LSNEWTAVVRVDGFAVRVDAPPPCGGRHPRARPRPIHRNSRQPPNTPARHRHRRAKMLHTARVFNANNCYKILCINKLQCFNFALATPKICEKSPKKLIQKHLKMKNIFNLLIINKIKLNFFEKKFGGLRKMLYISNIKQRG
ncbi:hypothetical protein, partial [Ruminobacter amylophilus]|uniref:hypothetical protein n=1 Tax=Ruminobacter amylophilus TaxID=867 RepID=UPI00386F1375